MNPEDEIGHLVYNRETGHLCHNAETGHLVYKSLFLVTTGWAFVYPPYSPPRPRWGAAGRAVYTLSKTDEEHVFEHDNPRNGAWSQLATLRKVGEQWEIELYMVNWDTIYGLLGPIAAPGERWFRAKWTSPNFYGNYTVASFTHWGTASNQMTALEIM